MGEHQKGPVLPSGFNPSQAMEIGKKTCLWNVIQMPKFDASGRMTAIELIRVTCPKANMNLGKGGCDYWNTEKGDCNILLFMQTVVSIDPAELKKAVHNLAEFDIKKLIPG